MIKKTYIYIYIYMYIYIYSTTVKQDKTDTDGEWRGPHARLRVRFFRRRISRARLSAHSHERKTARSHGRQLRQLRHLLCAGA